MKTKSIKNPEDFHKLFDALTSDLAQASIYFKLHVDLKNETKEYLKEYNQSPAFWTLTFQALFDTSLLRLCRVYDTYNNSNSLRNLLDSIKKNPQMFDLNNFSERLKENLHREDLAKVNRVGELAQLNSHIDYADVKQNPIVKNLIEWRGNHFAHRNRDVVTEQPRSLKRSLEKAPLTYGQISELIDEGMKILNYYWKKFDASEHSPKLVGNDDYKFVLQSIRRDLERSEKEYQAFLGKDVP